MDITTVSAASRRFGPTLVVAELGDAHITAMSVSAWIDLPDHSHWRKPSPVSVRDFSQHMKSATGALAAKLRWVVAGELEGKLIKLDGHTRALLWAKGKLPRPPSVYVTAFRCTTRSELDALYGAYHFASANDPIQDQVRNAYRECGLELKSRRLKAGTIGLALQIAAQGTSKYTDPDVAGAVRMFAEELRQLDLIDPPNEMFQTGIVAAALLAMALDPAHLRYFARLMQRKNQEIRRKNGLLDPIAALLNMINNLQKKRGSWYKAQQFELCAAALTGAFAWQAGPSHPSYWVQESLPLADVEETVRRVRDLKRRTVSSPG